jgi:hypothetical protein
MLAIQAAANYQAAAPPPFAEDIKEDPLLSFAQMRGKKYASLFDMHLDLIDTFKRARDGHLVSFVLRFRISSDRRYNPVLFELLLRRPVYDVSAHTTFACQWDRDDHTGGTSL